MTQICIPSWQCWITSRHFTNKLDTQMFRYNMTVEVSHRIKCWIAFFAVILATFQMDSIFETTIWIGTWMLIFSMKWAVLTKHRCWREGTSAFFTHDCFWTCELWEMLCKILSCVMIFWRERMEWGKVCGWLCCAKKIIILIANFWMEKIYFFQFCVKSRTFYTTLGTIGQEPYVPHDFLYL